MLDIHIQVVELIFILVLSSQLPMLDMLILTTWELQANLLSKIPIILYMQKEKLLFMMDMLNLLHTQE